MAKLCVVDDEVSLLDLTVFFLERRGDQVSAFSSALEALKEIQNGAYHDIYILDFSMPDINGVELAKHIRSLHPSVPIVFVSGFLVDELNQFLSENPNTYFLDKPFRAEMLYTMIDQAFSK